MWFRYVFHDIKGVFTIFQGGSCSIYCENECNLGTTPSTTTTFTTMTTTAEKMTSTTGDLISTTSHGKFFICFIVTGNIKCNESSYGASNKFTLTLRKQLYVSPLTQDLFNRPLDQKGLFKWSTSGYFPLKDALKVDRLISWPWEEKGFGKDDWIQVMAMTELKVVKVVSIRTTWMY